MPREVIEAITYASEHYVMLDELHDKVGRAACVAPAAAKGSWSPPVRRRR